MRSTAQSFVCRLPRILGVAPLDLPTMTRSSGLPSNFLILNFVRLSYCIWNYRNEHEFRVAPSAWGPNWDCVTFDHHEHYVRCPSGAKASVSRRDDRGLWTRSLPSVYTLSRCFYLGRPSSISVDFCQPDTRTGVPPYFQGTHSLVGSQVYTWIIAFACLVVRTSL